MKYQKNKIDFNNAFFADIVFLVEGYSDYLFLEYIIYFKKFTSLEELNISIIEVGKTKIASYYKMYSKLNIHCFVFYDKDTNKAQREPSKYPNNDKLNQEIEQLNNIYGFEEDLEGFLDYNIDNKGEKVKKIQEWIEQEITEDKQSKIDEIWNKIENLFSGSL